MRTSNKYIKNHQGHSREYIEEKILARLKPRAGELPDSEVEPLFKKHLPALEVVINKILWTHHIPMFTDDDLVSFMYLKAHQLIRQGKIGGNRLAYGIFTAAFTNLIRDIIRMQKTNHIQSMRTDILDTLLNHRHGINLDIIIEEVVSYEELIELEGNA